MEKVCVFPMQRAQVHAPDEDEKEELIPWWEPSEVWCWSWKAWEMIRHWLGLWVTGGRTLATLLTGLFALPLVCYLTYLLDSSQTQLIPEIGKLHTTAPSAAGGTPSAALYLPWESTFLCQTGKKKGKNIGSVRRRGDPGEKKWTRIAPGRGRGVFKRDNSLLCTSGKNVPCWHQSCVFYSWSDMEILMDKYSGHYLSRQLYLADHLLCYVANAAFCIV